MFHSVNIIAAKSYACGWCPRPLGPHAFAIAVFVGSACSSKRDCAFGNSRVLHRARSRYGETGCLKAVAEELKCMLQW
eukprot:3495241-Amphidinium_carterae.1